MAIYEVSVADGFEWVLPCSEADRARLRELYDGPPVGDWNPPCVKALREDEGQRLRESDFPTLASQVLIMKSRACQLLRNELDGQGRLLPLRELDGEELWAFAPNILPLLDEKRSEVLRSHDDGRILLVLKPVFKDAAPAAARAWRLPYSSSPVFVSEHIADAVQSAGLQGLAFKEVG
jgi:hypothetical protein